MLFFIGMFIVVVGSVSLAYYLSKKNKDSSQTKLVNSHTKTYRTYQAYHRTEPTSRSNKNDSDFGTSFVVASVTDNAALGMIVGGDPTGALLGSAMSHHSHSNDTPSWSGDGGTFSGAGGSSSWDSGNDCSSSSSYDSGSSCDSSSSYDSGSSSFGGSD